MNCKPVVRQQTEAEGGEGSRSTPTLTAQVKALVAQGIREAIMIPNKAARQERLD